MALHSSYAALPVDPFLASAAFPIGATVQAPIIAPTAYPIGSTVQAPIFGAPVTTPIIPAYGAASILPTAAYPSYGSYVPPPYGVPYGFGSGYFGSGYYGAPVKQTQEQTKDAAAPADAPAAAPASDKPAGYSRSIPLPYPTPSYPDFGSFYGGYPYASAFPSYPSFSPYPAVSSFGYPTYSSYPTVSGLPF